MMGRIFWFAFLLTLTWTPAVLADELTTARDQPLKETAHDVQVSLKDGVATYRVRRTFYNGGTRSEEARLTIDLPHGAVATGLRIYAGGKWYEGDLMHRDKAEALYRELTGLGPSRPKDPALLFWNWTSQLGLRVFPIFAKKSSVVEYTLTVPTHYEGGSYFINYPRRHRSSKLATPVITIENGRFETIDAQTHRGAQAHLAPLATHPVLKQLGREEQRALVKTVHFPKNTKKDGLAIDVDIEHTWSGDLELELIDPEGGAHSLRYSHLASSENNLKERYFLDYGGPTSGKWHLIVSDNHPLDGGQIRSWTLTEANDEEVKNEDGAMSPGIPLPGRSVTDRVVAAIPQPNPSQGNIATLEVKSSKSSETLLRFGRVDFRTIQQFARVEADLATQLSELPKNHKVVFIVDLSHTMGVRGINAQLRLARAYLAHVPRAEFALIGTARHAKPLARFQSATQWAKVIATLQKSGKLSPQNGSFLDRGFAEAAKLLKGVKSSSAVLALTDDRLRPVWKNERALGSINQLPKRTTVHVADVTLYGDAKLTRHDEHRLFPLAKQRGGVAVVSEGAHTGKWTLLKREALYLVRPNRLDHARIDGLKSVLDDQSSLAEGESIRWMADVQSLPSNIELRGQLWSRQVSFGHETTEDFHRATAGFVFSLDHYHGLSEASQFMIASYAGAVSPVTSYLAIEPGVRPSTDGLELAGVGDAFGAGGLGLGAGGHRARRPHIDWEGIGERAKAACKNQAKSARLKILVDTNDHEIADVRSLGTSTPYSACVVEALWKEQLPRGVKGDQTQPLRI